MYNTKIIILYILLVAFVIISMGFCGYAGASAGFNKVSENAKERPTAYIDTTKRLDDYMITAIVDDTTVTALNIIDGKRYTLTVSSTYQNESFSYMVKKSKPDNDDIIITAVTPLVETKTVSDAETDTLAAVDKRSSCNCGCDCCNGKRT